MEAWRFAEQSAYQLFAEAEDPRLATILKFCKPCPKSKTDMTKELFQGHIRADELNALLDELHSKGKLIALPNQRGGPGRPSERFLAVN